MSLQDHSPERPQRDRDSASSALIVGRLLAVVLSAGGSLVAYGMLPHRIRIHWTFGLGPYYGPSTAPTAIVLAAVPALVGGVAVASYWADRDRRVADALAPVRPTYEAIVLGTLLVLLGVQALLVLANLP